MRKRKRCSKKGDSHSRLQIEREKKETKKLRKKTKKQIKASITYNEEKTNKDTV
jgi:hypothetical protein